MIKGDTDRKTRTKSTKVEPTIPTGTFPTPTNTIHNPVPNCGVGNRGIDMCGGVVARAVERPSVLEVRTTEVTVELPAMRATSTKTEAVVTAPVKLEAELKPRLIPVPCDSSTPNCTPIVACRPGRGCMPIVDRRAH